ncbi:hypothetical protein ACFY0Z_30085 [Streptomyces kronopolitis]|uniref:hypothetical protein n=1 Tax=Streptomyces kronopolitis TaxID=1612435 RepID=UPI003675F3C5
MPNTVRKPHAPAVSRLLNSDDRFWRAERVGQSGFVVERVAPRAEYLHGGPVTLIWSEGSQPHQKPEARQARQNERKAEMRAFLEEHGYALFVPPAGHLVVLTPEGAKETKQATAQADDLLGDATRQVRSFHSLPRSEEGENRTSVVSRSEARAELVLALRYNHKGVSCENGRSAITDKHSHTAFRPIGEATGTGPYLVRTEQPRSGDLSRHTSLTDAQRAAEELAGGGPDDAAQEWIWRTRGVARWQEAGACEWQLYVSAVQDPGGEGRPGRSTGFRVYGPGTEPPRVRPVVLDVAHTLFVDGIERHRGVEADRVRTYVSNGWRQGMDMDQDEKGTVRIEDRRYVPQQPAPAHGVAVGHLPQYGDDTYVAGAAHALMAAGHIGAPCDAQGCAGSGFFVELAARRAAVLVHYLIDGESLPHEGGTSGHARLSSYAQALSDAGWAVVSVSARSVHAVLEQGEPVSPANEGGRPTLTDQGLYDMYEGEHLAYRGVNPDVVLNKACAAEDGAAVGADGTVTVEGGLRFVPAPHRRRITMREGKLSLAEQEMAENYRLAGAAEGRVVASLTAQQVRSILVRTLKGNYAAQCSVWVETDEHGRAVIFAKLIPSELPTQYVPEVDKPASETKDIEARVSAEDGAPAAAAGAESRPELRREVTPLGTVYRFSIGGEPYVTWGTGRDWQVDRMPSRAHAARSAVVRCAPSRVKAVCAAVEKVRAVDAATSEAERVAGLNRSLRHHQKQGRQVIHSVTGQLMKWAPRGGDDLQPWQWAELRGVSRDTAHRAAAAALDIRAVTLGFLPQDAESLDVRDAVARLVQAGHTPAAMYGHDADECRGAAGFFVQPSEAGRLAVYHFLHGLSSVTRPWSQEVDAYREAFAGGGWTVEPETRRCLYVRREQAPGAVRLKAVEGAESYLVRQAERAMKDASGVPFISPAREPRRILALRSDCLRARCSHTGSGEVEHRNLQAEWTRRFQEAGFQDVREVRCGVSALWPTTEPTRALVEHIGPMDDFCYRVTFPGWGAHVGGMLRFVTAGVGGCGYMVKSFTGQLAARGWVREFHGAVTALACHWGLPAEEVEFSQTPRGAVSDL